MDVTRWGDGVAAHWSHFAQGAVRLIHVVLTRDDEQVRHPTMAMRVDAIHHPATDLFFGRKFDEKIHHSAFRAPSQWREYEVRRHAAPRHLDRASRDVAIIEGV